MSSIEAAARIKTGLMRAMPSCQVIEVPIADGGDGTARAVIAATNGSWVECAARDPLGRPITAGFGVDGSGGSAVIEMALASGLALLTPQERNPLQTSTWGVGDLIKAALEYGAREILLGIGGSATNDGGMGMASALGARFLDASNKPLAGTGADLKDVVRVDLSGLDPRLTSVSVRVACDVNNPLCGAQGAAFIYAPQKGADPATVVRLDQGLNNLAKVIQRDLGVDIATLAGAGAAGGLGAALKAFLNAELQPGAELTLDICNIDAKLPMCDWVITGEGRLDGQSAYGKAPAALARRARKHNVPVIALGGCLGADVAKLHEVGINAWFATLTDSITEEEVPLRGPDMLEQCAEQVGRLLAAACITCKRTRRA